VAVLTEPDRSVAPAAQRGRNSRARGLTVCTTAVRAAAVAGVVAACSPEIADGSYFCGDQALCPVGDKCNGPDNTCVLAGFALPFQCPTNSQQPEPDNTPAEAIQLPGFTCVSTGFDASGCLAPGDPADWVKLTAPTGCISLQINVHVDFPTAWEPIELQLLGSDGVTQVATGSACVSEVPGDSATCLLAPGSDGEEYFLGFVPGPNCGGDCNFNSYTYGIAVGAQ
jgi:hypothetical protein